MWPHARVSCAYETGICLLPAPSNKRTTEVFTFFGRFHACRPKAAASLGDQTPAIDGASASRQGAAGLPAIRCSASCTASQGRRPRFGRVIHALPAVCGHARRALFVEICPTPAPHDSRLYEREVAPLMTRRCTGL